MFANLKQIHLKNDRVNEVKKLQMYKYEIVTNV